MQAIEKRIAALEQASPPADGRVVIHRIVRPGHLDAEICRLRGDGGELWERLPGETEQAFIDRSSGEVKRNPWGCARLISEGIC